jgi:hypothetical protein
MESQTEAKQKTRLGIISSGTTPSGEKRGNLAIILFPFCKFVQIFHTHKRYETIDFNLHFFDLSASIILYRAGDDRNGQRGETALPAPRRRPSRKR